MTEQASIETEGLVREFRKGPRAVDGIDLRVSPVEIYGFLGPNGAGKSTTVLMLTTLLPPTAGRASVGGYDIVRQGSQVRASIGAALQEAALDSLMTGREHLRLQATLQGVSKAERDRRVKQLVLTDADVEASKHIRATMSSAPEAFSRLPAADQRALRDILRRALGPE